MCSKVGGMCSKVGGMCSNLVGLCSKVVLEAERKAQGEHRYV